MRRPPYVFSAFYDPAFGFLHHNMDTTISFIHANTAGTAPSSAAITLPRFAEVICAAENTSPAAFVKPIATAPYA